MFKYRFSKLNKIIIILMINVLKLSLIFFKYFFLKSVALESIPRTKVINNNFDSREAFLTILFVAFREFFVAPGIKFLIFFKCGANQTLFQKLYSYNLRDYFFYLKEKNLV
jgi:hypothetical protein